MAGVTMGNLNAIAMEPMGHIAGMAASVIGSIATVLAAAIAAPIGLLFDGSITPLDHRRVDHVHHGLRPDAAHGTD